MGIMQLGILLICILFLRLGKNFFCHSLWLLDLPIFKLFIYLYFWLL